MKRGTPRHPKVDALADLLDIPRYSAIGLLECLFHFTAEFARDGNIGRYTDASIGLALYWDGDSTMLVRAMIASHWLDECECHRLRVHDWPDHADQTVQRVLSKHNQGFIECYSHASIKLAHASTMLACLKPKANSLKPVANTDLRADENSNPSETDSSPPPPDANIPTEAEVLRLASCRSIPQESARRFFAYHQGNNLWLNRFGRLIDWPHKLQTWATNDRERHSTIGGNGSEHLDPNDPKTKILLEIEGLRQSLAVQTDPRFIEKRKRQIAELEAKL